MNEPKIHSGSGPNTETGHNIINEVKGARNKFPSNKYLLTALIEEVGELGKALMEHSLKPTTDGYLNVYTEAIQVAAMAIRIAEEGDPNFEYFYSEFLFDNFKSTSSK